jgi:SAM-dependent methyltransferase
MSETTFYDDHPFDWTEGYTRSQLEATLAPMLATFIQDTPPDALVLDLGCGVGRVTRCLAAGGLRAIGLDLSFASVRRMVTGIGKPGVVGDGIRLPFADGSVDRVIADGVIHHTPNPKMAFSEGCRILKPDGLFYLAVYKTGGHYQKLYRFPGGVIRRLVKSRAGEIFVHLTLLPVYYLVHLAKSRGKRSWAGAKNLFYDYFVTPIAEFLSYEDVDQWSKTCGVEIVDYHPNPPLNVHSFLIQKRAT